MTIAVVGAGLLGLTLAHRLAAGGHRVDLFDGAGEIGGLSAPHDYGEFVWDRFYHCILPGDRRLLRLIGELGLAQELRWKATRTGYFAGGRSHSMSGHRDFLRFPLLSPLAKFRLALAVLCAGRTRDPRRLYTETAEHWLRRLCGEAAYRGFWLPLLRAKFGPLHDRVAAVFLWATLTRLAGARGAGGRERLGYVRGGYATVLGALRRALDERGVAVRLQCPVERIERADGEPAACRITAAGAGGRFTGTFDLVLFTGPTPAARRAVAGTLVDEVERTEREYPAARTYLGVACLVLALPRALTPYYVLNIGDEAVGLTGLIEMTNLIDAGEETAGRALVFLPRYLDSGDPRLEASDEELLDRFFGPGLRRLFGTSPIPQAAYAGIHRARFVQPLPGVRRRPPPERPLPGLRPPFQIVNTTMLECATLNNDEVVGLADAFLERNREPLGLRPFASAGSEPAR